MSAVLAILVVLLLAVVAIWLINQIPLPAGLEIVRTILIVIVVFFALFRLFGMM